MDFNYLTKENIAQYLQSIGYLHNTKHVEVILFNEDVTGSEGYVNNVFRVTFQQENKSYIVKQFLNYARDVAQVIGQKIPYSPKRMTVEVKALQFMKKLLPQALPAVYYVDDVYHVIIMEDLSYLKNIRYEFVQERQFENFGITIGIYLATWYFYTCDYFISTELKSELEQELNSYEQKAMLHKLLFGENSVFSCLSHRHFEQPAQNIWLQIIKNDVLQDRVKKCGEYFLYDNHCMSHNDFHLGNILANDKNICIIDTECSGYSNSAVDLGRIVGSLLLNYLSWIGRLDLERTNRQLMQQYIIKMIRDIYESYDITVKLLLQEYHIDFDMGNIIENLFMNSFNYAAITIMGRLSSDNARPYDIMQIKDNKELARIQLIGMYITQSILTNVQNTTVDDFLNIIMKYGEIV